LRGFRFLRLNLFLFLKGNWKSEVVIKLLLRLNYRLRVFWENFLEDLIGSLLWWECFSELLRSEVSLRHSLMTRSSLNVLFTIHTYILLQVNCVRVNCGLLVFDFLVHESQVKVDRSDFWVNFSSNQAQNKKSSMHVCEAHTKVPAVMVVHGKSGVLVCDLRVI